VTVVQWLECWDVAPVVMGSSPISHLMVLWRNWIAHLNTNQEVVGSNPTKTTSCPSVETGETCLT
jgi:hypothetical protein